MAQRRGRRRPAASRRQWLLLGGGMLAVVTAAVAIAVVVLIQGDKPAELGSVRESAHAVGDPEAPVTVVEFGDFQ